MFFFFFFILFFFKFFIFFFFKQKTAYEILAWLEFRRVLFRSSEKIKLRIAKKCYFIPASLPVTKRYFSIIAKRNITKNWPINVICSSAVVLCLWYKFLLSLSKYYKLSVFVLLSWWCTKTNSLWFLYWTG